MNAMMMIVNGANTILSTARTTRREFVLMTTTATTTQALLEQKTVAKTDASDLNGTNITATAYYTDNNNEKEMETDYFKDGPYTVRALPKIEHVSASTFPMCIGSTCKLSIKALVPVRRPVNPDDLFPSPAPTATQKGEMGTTTVTKNSNSNRKAPFPLAVFSSGFLVDAESYDFIAKRLCSFGYVVLRYDKSESLNETLDDVVSASLLDDLISWASYSSGILSSIVDPEKVMLIGHSRGGKISVLESLYDKRVKCLALIDPVDNTQYAPLGPGFPSAVEGMKDPATSVFKEGLNDEPPAATLVIGGLRGGECAPIGSNYANFFEAATIAKQNRGGAEPWGFTLDAGHFDFLDEKTFIQSSVCDLGKLDDKITKQITAAAVATHADWTFRNTNRISSNSRGNSNNNNNDSSGSSSSSSSNAAASSFFAQLDDGDRNVVELV